VRPQSLIWRAVLLAAAAPLLSAQWLNFPTRDIPRTRDGKPNLTAAAPRTAEGKPDLSGIWSTPDGKYLQNLAADVDKVPFQPWAEALFNERRAREGKGRPSERCLPHGITDFDALPWPRKILQTRDVVVILFEAYNHYRQIFLDGRQQPQDPQPTWFGYSSGKWDGDTLVVDTIGFNNETWLDDGGHPHSDALHVIERFHRKDFGHMELQVTIDDPKAYTKPWSATMNLELMPDTEMIEFICENEKDSPHMVGK